jgi:predicted transglutaminase-like cysteine proteinase
MKFWFLALLLATAAYGISQGANARSMTAEIEPLAHSSRMSLYGSTEAPIGHVKFCYYHPEDCRDKNRGDAEVILTTQRWEELQAVNQQVNLAVKPLSDQTQYGTIEVWTYPTSGKGDCEDYVLLKKRKLIEKGWPANALLITVVRDENDEGHAILTVRTHRGDLILDNKHSKILAWQNTPYAFIKRQSAFNPRNWDSLVPLRINPTVAASGADANR